SSVSIASTPAAFLMSSRMLATRSGMSSRRSASVGMTMRCPRTRRFTRSSRKGRLTEGHLGSADETDLWPGLPLVGPKGRQFALALEEVEKEHLGLGWKRLNFVEKESTSISPEELPHPRGRGSRVSAFHVTQYIALKLIGVRREEPAIERDVGTAASTQL